LCEHVSEVVFEGYLIGLGGYCSVVGLVNRGELVLDESFGLKLFPWAVEDCPEQPLHNFEEVDEK